tara:strand:- start:1477 stop:2676 length:1200 start_codon:yes stop_codon:yes gene_type:complete
MTYLTNAFAHGIGNSAVSSQWYSRPADQKFLSLDTMLDHKRADAKSLTSRIVNTHKMKVVGDMTDANPTTGEITVEYTDENGRENSAAPTNWSFAQLAQLSGAPAAYLRDLPAPLAADCIGWGLRYNRGKELVKVYDSEVSSQSAGQLRAATGPDYGRIYDWEILEPIKQLVDASDGRWKVPGMMTGSRHGMAVYDPEIPVSLETTTLFASDRDVFVFLVDDRNPIEVGTLANGEPDLMFRGFYAWNSETGSKTAGIAAMYLRGVCMNRNLWGVENFSEIKIRHTKFAPDRFAMEARPALQSFAQGATKTFVEGVQAAKAAVIAKDDDERLEFLTRRAGLSQRMAKAAAARHLEEEGRPVESVWDVAQAITAIARDVPHQDARVEMEKRAGALLDKVTA